MLGVTVMNGIHITQYIYYSFKINTIISQTVVLLAVRHLGPCEHSDYKLYFLGLAIDVSKFKIYISKFFF